MWVADMDFLSPPSAIEAMIERAKHGVFGYTIEPPKLQEVIVERMKKLYNWDIAPEDIIFSPGMVTALNGIAKGFGDDGDAVLLQTPLYGPFFSATRNNRKFTYNVDMAYVPDNEHTFHYEADYDEFERAASEPQTTIHFLCNPHNPAGFMYSRDELERIAEVCLKHNVLIAADEIHSDLLLEGKHTPIATLSEEVAQNTITMIAPSKTYNLAGMGCSVLIAQNPEIRERLYDTMRGMGLHVNIMGYEAAYGAYTGGNEWLEQLLIYLKVNRDYALDFIQTYMPQIKTTVPSATYLLWMDMRGLNLEGSAFDFCTDEAKLIFNDGNFFGSAGDGFVRLNFGCPRATLEEGLQRLRSSVEQTMALV